MKEERIYERNPDTGEIRSREFGDYGNERIDKPGIKRHIVYSDEEMAGVNNCLIQAKQFGLDVEVILTSIKIARENPDITAFECMYAALSEWDCM
jgi:hypothetical protein